MHSCAALCLSTLLYSLAQYLSLICDSLFSGMHTSTALQALAVKGVLWVASAARTADIYSVVL